MNFPIECNYKFRRTYFHFIKNTKNELQTGTLYKFFLAILQLFSKLQLFSLPTLQLYMFETKITILGNIYKLQIIRIKKILTYYYKIFFYNIINSRKLK